MISTLIAGGWSQGKLASYLGVRQATISRIATGAARDPGWILVSKLQLLVLQLDAFGTGGTP